MEHTMHAYIHRQRAVLSDMIRRRHALAAPFARFYSETRPSRLYIVGSGTSQNAAATACAYMSALLQVEVSPAIPSRLPRFYGERPAAVFLSQGGSSTNMLAAMEELSAYPSIAITGEPACEIGRRSGRHMLIGCGEELAGPKTLGYTASVLCLYLCALEAAAACGTAAAERCQDDIAALQAAVDNMEENLRRCQEWLEGNRERLCAADRYLFLGHGSAAHVAQEAALKLLETVRRPALSYEFEEYLHGPILVAEEKMGGLVFLPRDPRVRAQMEELVRCHAVDCPGLFAVSGGESGAGVPCLQLIQGGRAFTEVFEFILPAQVMAASLPALMGIGEGCPIEERYLKTWQTKYQNGR